MGKRGVPALWKRWREVHPRLRVAKRRRAATLRRMRATRKRVAGLHHRWQWDAAITRIESMARTTWAKLLRKEGGGDE